MSCLFDTVVPLFRGRVCDQSELPIPAFEDTISKGGRIVHRWTAFGSISLMAMEDSEKVDVNTDLKVLATLLAQVDASDRLNEQSGHCVPVINISYTKSFFRVLAFHPDKNEVYLSKVQMGFSPDADIRHIVTYAREMAERFYFLMLTSYINALIQFHCQPSSLGSKQGSVRPSTEKWKIGLGGAKQAFLFALRGSQLVKDWQTADEYASIGLKKLRDSAEMEVNPRKEWQPFDIMGNMTEEIRDLLRRT